MRGRETEGNKNKRKIPFPIFLPFSRSHCVTPPTSPPPPLTATTTSFLRPSVRPAPRPRRVRPPAFGYRKSISPIWLRRGCQVEAWARVCVRARLNIKQYVSLQHICGLDRLRSCRVAADHPVKPDTLCFKMKTHGQRIRPPPPFIFQFQLLFSARVAQSHFIRSVVAPW